MTTGRYDEARRHGEAALELARDNGRTRDMAVAENNLTWHEIREGDLAAARRRLAAVDRLATRAGEFRLRAVAAANLAEVARLDGQPDEAVRLGRKAIAELVGVGDPNHQRRVLATVGLALATLGRLPEAEDVLAELRAPADARIVADGPASLVAAAIALQREDWTEAAESFARAADAYEGGHDPRDVVEALVGLIVSTTDPAARRDPIRRLRTMCRSNGITLLPRERAVLGEETATEISGISGISE
jgi:ATP/maltotriose-dependent transcriptional regulator MalT